MSFLGINLAPLGKKLSDIEGAVGQFFGGAPAPAPVAPPQQQAAANIGAAAGIGPAPVSMSPTTMPGLLPNPAATVVKPKVTFKPLTFGGQPNLIDVAREAVTGIDDSFRGVGQGFARVAPTVLASVAQPGADAINTAMGQPTSPISIDPKTLPGGNFIFGKDPITTYQTQAQGAADWAKSKGVDPTTANVAAIPLAGAMAASDLFPGGKGGKAVVENIAKETNPAKIAELLAQHFGESAAKIPDNVVTALAGETDPKAIKGILSGKIPAEPVHAYVAGEKATNFVEQTGNQDFDLATTNPHLRDYQRFEKGRDVNVVNMAPEEYLRRSYANGTWDIAGQEMLLEKSKIAKYAADMKNGDRFPRPWLDFNGSGDNYISQEGRHRAAAAKELGQKTIPVTVVSKAHFTKAEQDAYFAAEHAGQTGPHTDSARKAQDDYHKAAKPSVSMSVGKGKPEGPTTPGKAKKASVAQSPKVKIVDTPAGKVKVAETWKDGEPAGMTDVPPAPKTAPGGNGPMTPEQRKAILSSPEQQPTTKLPHQAQTAEGVMSDTEGILRQRHENFNKVLNLGTGRDTNLGHGLSANDLSKLSDAANGEKVGHVDNPELFQKTIDATHEAMDHDLAAKRKGGQDTMRRNKGETAPLFFKADKEALDKLGIPEDQRYDLGKGKQGFTDDGSIHDASTDALDGYHNQQRKYNSYADAEKKTGGILKPANANMLEDIRQYAKGGAKSVQDNLLHAGLSRLHPGEISSNLNTKFGKNGEPLVHAAGGNLSFNVTKNLDRKLNGYRSARLSNPAMEAALKATETVSKGTRKVAFLAAPVHYGNISTNYAGAVTAGAGRVDKAVADNAKAMVAARSTKAYEALRSNAEASGKIETARNYGIVQRPTQPDLIRYGTGTRGTVDKFSTFSDSQRAMSRYTNVLSWELGDMMKKTGLEAGTEAATKAGKEMNMVLDTLDPRAEGLNPIAQRIFTSGSLAPNWIRSQVGLVRDAVIGGGKRGVGMSNSGDIARSAVIGKRALEATVAIVGSAMITGQMPTWAQAFNEAGLNPNNPVPNIDGNQKNTKGQPVVTNMPTDQAGLAVGLATNPSHFLTARETPLLAALSAYLSNKDWAGNQLADPSKPGFAGAKAAAAAKTLEPFVAQSAQDKNLTTPQKIAATVALRTHRDPNDPNYQQSVAYAKGMNQAQAGASEPDATAIKEYLSRQTDGQGNKIPEGVAGGRANAVLLLKNTQQGGQALQRVYDVEHGLSSTDPLWKLPLDAPAGQPSVKAYLEIQQMFEGAEKTGTKERLQGAPVGSGGWIDQLGKDRTAYFNNLPPSTNPAKANEPAYPTVAPAVQAAMDAYGKIGNSAQKAAFLKAHPEVTDAFAQSTDWTNKIRGIEGAPELKGVDKPSPEVQKIMDTYNAIPKGGGSKGGNLYRSQWITSHPNEYSAMSNFLAGTSMNSLLKNSVESVYAGQNSQTLLKDIKNVGTYDITQSTSLDANGNPTYGMIGQPGAGPASTTSAGASSAKNNGGTYSTKMKKFKAYGKSGGKGKLSRAKLKSGGSRVAMAGKEHSGKPKVSIKHSLV